MNKLHIAAAIPIILLAACSPNSHKNDIPQTSHRNDTPQTSHKNITPKIEPETKKEEPPHTLSEWPLEINLLCNISSSVNSEKHPPASVEKFDYRISINKKQFIISPSIPLIGGYSRREDDIDPDHLFNYFYGDHGPEGVMRVNGKIYLKFQESSDEKITQREYSLLNPWRENFFESMTGGPISLTGSITKPGDTEYVTDTYNFSLSGLTKNNTPLEISLECTNRRLSAQAQAIEDAREAAADEAERMRKKSPAEILIKTIASSTGAGTCPLLANNLEHILQQAETSGDWSRFRDGVDKAIKFGCLDAKNQYLLHTQ